MADTRIISVIGKKAAGKTTLLVALASEFARKGRRVMTLEQAAPAAGGSSSQGHFHEGKVERSLVVSPELGVLHLRRPDLTDPVALAQRYLVGGDIVLVEGFTDAPLPKIEVFRRTASRTPLFDPNQPNAGEWLAIVTDEDRFEAPVPVLRFHDTMWLHLLANMAWERARLL